jgi:septation ring formation regulator EzrA
MKRISKARQDKIYELERNLGKEKENVPTNINKGPEMRAIENENTILKKKLQEIEEKSQVQTDDVKASVNLEAELDTLKKKYDTVRRLCNLRNDDNSKLHAEIASLKVQLAELKEKYDAKAWECLKIKDKYLIVKDICGTRLDTIIALRARLGEPTDLKNPPE